MKTGVYPIEEFHGGMDFDNTFDGRAGPINRAFLAKEKQGLTLNICCGTDRTGDVLMDVDLKMKPHVQGDLHNPPFRDKAFDTVICDPPFSYFARFKWLMRLTDLARRKIILSTPTIIPHLPKSWHRRIFCTDDGHLFMRIWQVWTHDRLEVAAK